MEPDAQPSFIAIARIARTRGNRGEVLADLYTDFPDRFNHLEEVWLEFQDGHRQLFVLEDTWEHKGRIVLKFAGVDTINSAEPALRALGGDPGRPGDAASSGTYFDHDLIGCEVCRIDRARSCGMVAEVLQDNREQPAGGTAESREFLIPAVESICVEISIEEKQILIDPPEGLMDLGK